MSKRIAQLLHISYHQMGMFWPANSMYASLCMAIMSSPQYIAAGCGLPMMRFHIALKSNVQFSMGPRDVAAQSILRAN